MFAIIITNYFLRGVMFMMGAFFACFIIGLTLLGIMLTIKFIEECRVKRAKQKEADKRKKEIENGNSMYNSN